MGDITSGEFWPTFGPPEGSGRPVRLGFVGEGLLVNPENVLPNPGLLDAMPAPRHHLEIGRIGDLAYELLVWPTSTPLPAGVCQANFRTVYLSWPRPLLDAVCRARQLAFWLRENRFCGVCGAVMETAERVPERRCPECGFLAYPRIAPVCIVLVIRGDELLLARSPHFPPGMYSGLAGYVEAGESVEACVRREVREEAGIEVGNLRWFGSQCWPFPHSLMLGFFADYAGGRLVIQEEELEDAGWYRRDSLPPLPHPSTIACRMIHEWLERTGGRGLLS